MRKLILLLVLGLIPQSILAVEIPRNVCVSNRQPGYCEWACLETLGNLYKVPALKNLVERRSHDFDEWIPTTQPNTFRLLPRNVGTDFVVKKKLDRLKVKYELIDNFNEEALKRIDKEGAVGTFYAGAFGGMGHAVVLTACNAKKVEWIDPNDVTWIMWADRSWFDYWWSGTVIFINKDQK